MFDRFFLVISFVCYGLFAIAQEDVLVVDVSNARLLNKKAAVYKGGKGSGQEGRGVYRREDFKEGYPERSADLSVSLVVPESGCYLLEAESFPYDFGLLKDKDTTGVLLRDAYFQFNSDRITKRIVYDSRQGGKRVLGKFDLLRGRQELKIWLPDNLVLSRIRMKLYEAPEPLDVAENYHPTVTPPKGHPRLWVNQESLVTVRSRLFSSENKPVWDKLVMEAKEACPIVLNPKQETFYNEELERIIERKSFYYLMTEDRQIGREAVQLMDTYLNVLEFGNVTYGDISREIGRAIYTAALVYDWCFPLLTGEEKAMYRKHMLRLARDMEIGWPPFHGAESIINGHGNEAQICRDLLAMSIAIFDEDPTPYKFTSYTVLEQLVPMRKFEYASSRHNQGIDYGGYRFAWEMHAVWFFYRMLGREVFDSNIKNLPYYWVYMRTPDGKMMRDGDMFNVKYANSDDFYWKNPQTMLLCYAYAKDPLIKGEFYKQGGLPDNPVLFLLLNDPSLPPLTSYDGLPLSKDFGDVLGGMLARTGWDQRPESSDVVAEIKGGGYHFGNHQHADAGALQLYYRGIQVGDLGLYLSYGPPYDFNFNKRSVAHSMMLVKDPKEPLRFRTEANDGGTRFSQLFPRSPEEALSNPWFSTGQVKSSTFGPDKIKPFYSYFQVDLAAAYTAKVKSYVRSFCFLNMFNDSIPAVVILADHIRSADSSFRKYWQINTLYEPLVKDGDWVLHNQHKGMVGKTYVKMLVPAAADREVQILNGSMANNVFGFQYTPNSSWPEAKGSRIMVSPAHLKDENSFLTVFQMAEEGVKPYVVDMKMENDVYVLQFADVVVCLPKHDGFIEKELLLSDLPNRPKKIVIAGLQSGFWQIIEEGHAGKNVEIKNRDNVYSFETSSQNVILKPGRQYGLMDYQMN
ncbi:hypothetical protein [Sphingobacterium sp. LRF_L2]|uniref:hypothetical protein n=1 Tax=Sphingobacterium sp. LRF_L2 TaxID=3369421 RepID=UPI003F63FEA3